MKRYIAAAKTYDFLTLEPIDAERLRVVETVLHEQFPGVQIDETSEANRGPSFGIIVEYRGQRVPKSGWIVFDSVDNLDSGLRKLAKAIDKIDAQVTTDVRAYAYQILEYLGWHRDPKDVKPIKYSEYVEVTFREKSLEKAQSTLDEFQDAANTLNIPIKDSTIRKVPDNWSVGPYWPYKVIIIVPQYLDNN